MDEVKGTWREELPALLKFAAPICASQLAALGMGMTDVIVAGNAGKEDLAGVMIGANLWHIFAIFFFGIGLANAPIIGRHFGVLNWDVMRTQIQQSTWLALACGFLAVICVLVATSFLYLWDIDAEVLRIATGYLWAVLPGVFALSAIPAFRASLESMNEIHFAMRLSIAGFLLNIIVDCWFVYGGLGVPAMGGVGCGLATSIVLMLQLAIYFWYLVKAPRLSKLNLMQSFGRPKWSLIKPTLVLGLPIGLSMLMEIGFFGGMGLRMADIGVVEAGAHAVALNIAAFMFMFFISIGHAVTVRASHAIGQDRSDVARQIVRLGLVSIVLLASVSSVLTFLLRGQLPLLFNQDVEVVYLAGQFLIYAALFQFFDGLQAMAICALRAYKDTAAPSLIQFVAFWVIGLPLGIFLPGMQVGDEVIGSAGVWVAFCVSLVVSSIVLLLRLYWLVFRKSLERNLATN